MRRSGVITRRREKRERGVRMRRRAMIAGLVFLLCALAMSDQLKERLTALMQGGVGAVQTFAGTRAQSKEIVLEEKEVYALQLGVFDNGERAQSERERLVQAGVPCVIWQRDKMRIICSVAASKDGLDLSAAGGNEAYVVRDILPKVCLRISCAAGEREEAEAFVRLPDALLEELLDDQGKDLGVILSQTRWQARKAMEAHPENALYVQLAQSLMNWCLGIEETLDQPTVSCYAAVTMCTIAREWRNTLLDQSTASADSTASAQRTPSTAADVMPPA